MSAVVIIPPGTLEIRHYFREHFVEPGERVCVAPSGDYDVAALLKSLPGLGGGPTLLLLLYDFSLTTRPHNLSGVGCPKVLLVGDTHHRMDPLTHAVQHAVAERYDLIVGQYVRQHLHFFREVVATPVAWIPAFMLKPFEHPPGPLIRDVLFVGSTDRHPIRQYVLEQLNGMGVAVTVGTAGPDFAAQEYNRTAINLNISLNGDLNLRNFEIMAASGFLVTERLSPESGQELLFQDRRQLVLFDSAEHLRDLIRYYLTHPREAQAIAAEGHAQYLRHHTPARKIQQFHEALARGIAPELSVDLDRRVGLPWESLARVMERIRLYERLQELHRCNVELKMLFWEGLDREAIDAVDFSRFKVSLVSRPGGGAVDACGLGSRIRRLLAPEVDEGGEQWAFLLVTPRAFGDPVLHRVIQRRRASYLLVAQFVPEVDGGALEAFGERFGLKRCEPMYPLFALPGVGADSA